MGKFHERLIQNNGHLIARWLCELGDQIDRAAPGPARAIIVVYLHGREPQVGEITVSDEVGTLSATVTFLDAKGATTSPDGVPSWSSSDDTIASVVAAADGLSAVVTVGTVGAAAIEVVSQETDNETGDPYELRGSGLVNVTAGDAVVASVEFSAA